MHSLPWLYFTLLHCTTFYTMVLLDSAFLYHGSTSLYFTLHYCAIAQGIILNSTLLYHSYFALFHSTLLFHGSTSLYLIYCLVALLYFIILDSPLLYHSSTSLSFTLHYFSMALLNSLIAISNLRKTLLAWSAWICWQL